MAKEPGSLISEAVGMGLMEDVFSSANSSKTAKQVQGPGEGEGEAMSLPSWAKSAPRGPEGLGTPPVGTAHWLQLLLAQGLDLGCCWCICPGIVLPCPQHCSSLSPQCLVPMWVSSGVTSGDQLCCYTLLLGERCGEKAVIAFNITPVLSNLPNVKWLFALHIFIFIIRRQRHRS